MGWHLLVFTAAGALGLAEIAAAQMISIGPRLAGRAFVPQIEL